jgi:hypothetical protein
MGMSLLEKLEAKYPENFSDCFDFSPPEGWNDLVEKLVDRVIALDPEIKIQQVKEKFAELRFYVGEATDDVHFLIETAEDASTRTCQRCGKEGKCVNVHGYYVTLCEEHENDIMQRG